MSDPVRKSPEPGNRTAVYVVLNDNRGENSRKGKNVR